MTRCEWFKILMKISGVLINVITVSLLRFNLSLQYYILLTGKNVLYFLI